VSFFWSILISPCSAFTDLSQLFLGLELSNKLAMSFVEDTEVEILDSVVVILNADDDL
jgi:hypothetical protein